MADHYPYTPNPPNVGRFLDHIQDSGVPNKVTSSQLPAVGFKSSNDRYIPGVLKFIGFVDSSSSPTDKWRAYKDKGRAKQVLAAEVRTAYSDLFSVYPDAYRKDDEALHNYFASKTGLATRTVERIVGTFKILCEMADFEASAPPSTSAAPVPSSGQPTVSTTPLMPSVNLNIQLHLPPTDDASVYDKLFAAMKKHLFS